MASNVPKFASFRPKPKVTSESTQETPRDRTPDRKSREKKSKRPEESPPPAKKPRLEECVDASGSKVYYRDRRGDPDILKYGTLNRYDIPAYRRFGYGYVLGLDLTHRIKREESSDKVITLTSTISERKERALVGKHGRLRDERGLQFIKPNTDLAQPENEFISVSEQRQSKINEESSDSNGECVPDYRNPRSQDQTFSGDSNLLPDQDEQSITRINAKLTRKIRDEPEDLQAWLDLVGHQDAIVRHSHITAEDLGDAARKHLAEMRISLLEEAIKKNARQEDAQIKLHQQLLFEAQFVLSQTKLMIKWKDVITRFPHSFELWLRYLNHVQSSMADFKYEHCLSTFKEFFTAIQQGKSNSSSGNILHVFIRLTSMIHQAGYQELALAVWQAILELRIFPKDQHGNHQTDTEDFERFWESEVPRIGEVGSRGWLSANLEDDAPSAQPPPSSNHPEMSTFRGFEIREMEAALKMRYPGRAAHDVAEDDAFHTIFYSDIVDYTSFLPASIPVRLVLEAFLCFCGLPPLAISGDHQRMWWADPFLQHTSLRSPFRPQERNNHMVKDLHRFADVPFGSGQMSCEYLFAQEFNLDYINLDASFVRSLLKLVATQFPGEEAIGEYLLAFEARFFPAEVVKTAKQLIKAHPTSLRLYHAYGMVEMGRGKPDKADQALAGALSMQKSGDILKNSGGLLLLSSWVWAALDRGNQNDALWRLVSSRGQIPLRDDAGLPPDQETLSKTQILLSESCERALLRHDYMSGVIATSLLALLKYLSHNMDAKMALAAFAHLHVWFDSHKLSNSPYAELHAQTITRLLIYHISNIPMVQPSLVRDAVEPLLKQFPDNNVILALYAANEARFSIDDRVRGIMRQTALQASDTTSVAGWAFAIHYETLRGELAGSTSHSIRALYKRSTQPNASGAHCPEFWKSYLRFELGYLEKEKAKTIGQKPGKNSRKGAREVRLDEAKERAKETFFQGLRSIPWCKDFIMLAFREGRDVFTDDELWKVYRAMQEKELRLYIELDEV